jgi:excinuclease UvrABC ATPase subunit
MQYIECNNLNLHNLKITSVKIPKNKCTVITGVSGSGKSTLVFDILDKVGQTKYLSAIDMIPDQDVVNEFDIKGLSPTVCVSQNIKRQTNPRSTVGSRTGLLSLLQTLFALIGESQSNDIPLTPAMFSTNSATGMCYYCYGTGFQAEIDAKSEFRKLMLDQRPVVEAIHRNLRMPYKKYCKGKGINTNLSYSEVDNDVKEAVLFGDDDTYFKGIIPYLGELSIYAFEHGV